MSNIKLGTYSTLFDNRGNNLYLHVFILQTDHYDHSHSEFVQKYNLRYSAGYIIFSFHI